MGKDAVKTLPIKKQTICRQELPKTRFSNSLDKKKATWIVFSHHLSQHQFDSIDSYTGIHNSVIELWAVGHYEVALMSGSLTVKHEKVLKDLEIDYACLEYIPDLTKPGLIVFDMDSTAIKIECIDEIAKLAGVGEQVSKVTERAMQGELDFEQSLRQRVFALKGADETLLEQVRATLPFMPDLRALICSLQEFGWKTAIASGGFTYFSDHLKQELKLDYAQSNTLEIVDGKLTGSVLGDVVSAQTKADILKQLAFNFKVDSRNTVAVGDGANDLLMMDVAGLGIAYHAKPKVEQQAQVSVRFVGLGGVLCILSAQLAQNNNVR